MGLSVKFTYEQYRAQGLWPPCERAIYIPASSPHARGETCTPEGETEEFVAYEHYLMRTGGIWTTELWWVPVSELPIQPLP